MDYKHINPKQRPDRAFYRIYILPRHIDLANNNGNKSRAKLLQAELDEHLEWVKENKLSQPMKKYVGDQQARQDAYNRLAKLKGEMAVLRGFDMNRLEHSELDGHIKAVKKCSDDLTKAEEAFAQAKANFIASWEAGPKATVQKG